MDITIQMHSVFDDASATMETAYQYLPP